MKIENNLMIVEKSDMTIDKKLDKIIMEDIQEARAGTILIKWLEKRIIEEDNSFLLIINHIHSVLYLKNVQKVMMN